MIEEGEIKIAYSMKKRNTRLLCEDEVIKAIDKHTNDDGTLDNDISCILEEVKSAIVASSKEAMPKLKKEGFKYQFNVGDFVEDIDGNIGYIDFICECENCKERGFNEPRIRYVSGETDYIMVHQLEYLDKSYKRIGKYEFKRKFPVIESIDLITVKVKLDDGHSCNVVFSGFNKDTEIVGNCDNGKKTLKLIINGNYNMELEQ